MDSVALSGGPIHLGLDVRRLDAVADENGHQLYLMVLEKNGGEEELAALAPPADAGGDGWAQTFLARL